MLDGQNNRVSQEDEQPIVDLEHDPMQMMNMNQPLVADIPNFVPRFDDNDMDPFGSPDDKMTGNMMNLGVIPQISDIMIPTQQQQAHNLERIQL